MTSSIFFIPNDLHIQDSLHNFGCIYGISGSLLIYYIFINFEPVDFQACKFHIFADAQIDKSRIVAHTICTIS